MIAPKKFSEHFKGKKLVKGFGFSHINISDQAYFYQVNVHNKSLLFPCKISIYPIPNDHLSRNDAFGVLAWCSWNKEEAMKKIRFKKRFNV